MIMVQLIQVTGVVDANVGMLIRMVDANITTANNQHSSYMAYMMTSNASADARIIDAKLAPDIAAAFIGKKG